MCRIMEQIKMEGILEGILEGREKMLFELARRGTLSIRQAADEFGISEEDLLRRMLQAGYTPA